MTKKIIWNIGDLAEALGRTPSSIRVDLCRKNWDRVPRPIRLAGSVVFRPVDVDAWLAKKAKESGATIEETATPNGEPTSRRRRGRPKKTDKVNFEQLEVASGN